MVRWEGVEPPTLWFVARCSIQLSYQRTARAQYSENIAGSPEVVEKPFKKSHLQTAYLENCQENCPENQDYEIITRLTAIRE